MNHHWDNGLRPGRREILFSAVLMSVPCLGSAQGLSGRGYFTVDAGPAFLQDSGNSNLDLEGALDDLDEFDPGDDTEFDPGVRVGLMGGYRLSDAWSVELETGVIWNSVDSISGVSAGSSVNGITPDATVFASWYDEADLYQIPLLANLQYSFSFAQRWSVYLAGGVGAVIGVFHLGEGSSRVAGDEVLEVTERDADDDVDVVFGYQAKTGVRFAISPTSDLDLSYKFLGTTGYEWDVAGDQFGTHPLRNHAVALSYSFRF